MSPATCSELPRRSVANPEVPVLCACGHDFSAHEQKGHCALHECDCKLWRPQPKGSIQVDVGDVIEVVSWWRCANEAPGGCSFGEAIAGMQQAVWNLEVAKRDQTGHIT